MAFATFTAVNDTALHVEVSSHIIEAMVQNSLYIDGVGITQVTTGDIHAGAVRVPKLKVAGGDFRTLGATTNGGWFDTTSIVAKGLDEEVVELLYVYDTNEDVPVSQAALAVGGAVNVFNRAKMIGKKIAKGMNGGTLATQLVAVINAVITAGAETNRIFTYSSATSGDAYAKYLDASASLDNGDGSYNDYFPVEGRLVLARPTYEKDLKQNGNIIVGGSNFAQEMIKSGALDPETKLPEIINGYRGQVNMIPVFLASDAIWTEAERWMWDTVAGAALSAGYLDEIVALMCSHIATLRGHAIPESTKVIDSPSGQGLRIQPISNFGVKVAFEGGIKLIANGTFAEGSNALSVVSPGSQA